MKNFKDILQSGFRLIYDNVKFLWLFWGTNLAFSFVLSLPLYYILSDNLLHSNLSKKVIYEFDYIWFLQFKQIYATNISQIPYLIYGLAGIYILIQNFYVGGLLSVFHNNKKNYYVDFFYGGVKYWYRFAKVLLLSIIFYAIAFILNDLLGDVLIYAFANKENAALEFILRAIRYILLIFFIGIVSIMSDYIKVAIAVKDNNDIYNEIIFTIKFLKENFSKAFGVFIFVSLLGAFGAVVYNVIDNIVPKSTYFYFLFAFIIQQLLILFRLIVRMLFSATEITLYKDINAPIIFASVEEIHQGV